MTEVVGWHTIDFEHYSGKPTLYCSTAGCGCCSDGTYVSDPVEAVKVLLGQANLFEVEAKELRAWAHRITEAGVVVK